MNEELLARLNSLSSGNLLLTRQAAIELVTLYSEVDSLRRDYEGACKLVARMHSAATGSIEGPRLGVVEDVAAVRTELELLRKDLASAQETNRRLAPRALLPSARALRRPIDGGPK
jgi:hypothetical protein